MPATATAATRTAVADIISVVIMAGAVMATTAAITATARMVTATAIRAVITTSRTPSKAATHRPLARTRQRGSQETLEMLHSSSVRASRGVTPVTARGDSA